MRFDVCSCSEGRKVPWRVLTRLSPAKLVVVPAGHALCCWSGQYEEAIEGPTMNDWPAAWIGLRSKMVPGAEARIVKVLEVDGGPNRSFVQLERF